MDNFGPFFGTNENQNILRLPWAYINQLAQPVSPGNDSSLATSPSNEPLLKLSPRQAAASWKKRLQPALPHTDGQLAPLFHKPIQWCYLFIKSSSSSMALWRHQTKTVINKPAAQAAGADPSQCNSTNKQNPPIQQNRRNFWTSNAIWMPFKI